ncbi:bifunctional diguanylate cyclase/phosphodiesterase [Vibrio sp. 99-70-13A1]|uniref:putative bifunctional diguanylate cyclase/phosphodiesterase n=1 Tax=Vibrio sp. 99-70-13A1 TaxID=2607601 RepID=UPI0014936C4C|nr:bifunctional diguanylate cyclase/phosphodiesterase [Vibrio sp. 99-70-13A1]NOH95741.1 EAL domain-containing protein [Vibrio sp. 99-70-13A1]
MAKLSLNDTVNLDTISHILKLDGQDLLEAVALTLHREFGSQCTGIIEKRHFQDHTLPVVVVLDDAVQQVNIHSITDNLCSQESHKGCKHCSFTKQLLESLPNNTLNHEFISENYIAIPIKARNSDVMGVLYSTFTVPISNEDKQKLIRHHQMFANMINHTLQELWFSDRSEQLVNQLSYEVSHDNLTGLLNRSCLSDTLESITQQYSEPFTLAFIDIDNFKSINDANGNYIGDKVIQFTADTITSCVQDSALTFRTAGDEFAFITYDSDPIKICHNILNKIENGYYDNTHQLKFKISIGIARTQDVDKNIEKLLFNTSLALKDCKQHPEIQVQCYDTHLSASYHRKTQLVAAIRREIASPILMNQEMHVVVQPIVCKNQNEWDYFELLSRWQSPEYGMVSPVEFIKVAEQSGLIVELGERIMELGCIAKKQLEKGLGYKIKLGINCSAHELNDAERYLSHLTKMINKYDFEAREFVIELTETVLLTQTDDVTRVLTSLREMGFTIALDDFGTGYSSLNYIQSYPIDCLKIDATFIRNLLSNAISERVVWLIIQLAQQLNITLIAEGIEHQEELEKLHSMGCLQIQGYYYSKPEKPAVMINHLTHQEQSKFA